MVLPCHPGICILTPLPGRLPLVFRRRCAGTKLPPNFMGRQLKELLPPGERLIARINTQPFILDQGDDATDFPGDEFLLGYWLGRYVGAISAP